MKRRGPMPEMDVIYQQGYDAGLHGRDFTVYEGAEKTAWLHGHYDARCALARRARQPLPESPFKGKVVFA